MTDDATLAVLQEIRELLRPVAHAYRKDYDAYLAELREARADRLRKLVRGGKPLDACKLMDGNRTRGEIVRITRLDAGDMSRLVGSLRESELLESEEGSKPRLIFAAPEVEEIYKKS